MTIVLLLTSLAQLAVQLYMLVLVADETQRDGPIVEQVREVERRTVEELRRAAANSRRSNG